MAKNTALRLEKRNDVGGGRARRMLHTGLIPAVVYGRDIGSAAAFVKKNELLEHLKTHGKNSVFYTEFAEEHDFSVMVRDIQYDPVRRDIVHVDFQKVNSGEKVQVEVPVRLIGREQVEKAGNVVARQLDSVKVECLPGDIPQHADAVVSGLKPGHSFTAGDLAFSGRVTLISRPGEVILTVNGRDQAAAAENETQTGTKTETGNG